MKSYRTVLGHTDDWRSNVPSCTVISQERQERFSGLYDAYGNRLYAVDAPEPVGFVRFGETAMKDDK
jgi:hypothetical protein